MPYRSALAMLLALPLRWGENFPNCRLALCPPEPLTRPKGHPLPLRGGEGWGDGAVWGVEVRWDGPLGGVRFTNPRL